MRRRRGVRAARGPDTTGPAGPRVTIAAAGHSVPDLAAYTADAEKVRHLDAAAWIPGEETLAEGFVGPRGELVGRCTTGEKVWAYVRETAEGHPYLLRDPACGGRFTERVEPLPDRFLPPECAAPRDGVEVNPAGFPVPNVEGWERDDAASRRFDSLASIPGEETFSEVLVGPDGARLSRISTGAVVWAYGLLERPGDAASAYFVRDPACAGLYTEKLPPTAGVLPAGLRARRGGGREPVTAAGRVAGTARSLTSGQNAIHFKV